MKKLHFVFAALLCLVLSTLPVSAQSGAASAPAKTAAAKPAAADKIDINSASKEDLMKLDGVGDAISAKIIAGRPYKTKRDLLTKKIVNQATYAKITDKIIAH
jgi:DNA uptake protein ComE-like DNA-binding protein